jgi:hypothetical protein
MAGLLTFFRGAGGIQNRIAAQAPEPTFWKPKYQGGALDLAVNVALLALTAAALPTFVEPTYSRPHPPSVDIFPNIAVNLQTAVVQSPPDIAPARRQAPTIDLAPNIAATSTVAYVPATFTEPAFYKRLTPQIDVSPNVAVKFQTVITWPGPEPVFAKRFAPQIDISPNIAVEPPAARILSSIDIIPSSKRFAPFDLFPNLAATQLLFTPSPFIDPVYFRARQQLFDLFPNISILGSLPPSGPGSGIERRGGRVILPAKKLSETSIEQIDFISQLGPSETIVSAVCTCTVYEGIDPNPSAMISGVATITGTIVSQRVTGGVLGTIYEFMTQATTSLGQVIPLAAYLAVVPDLI